MLLGLSVLMLTAAALPAQDLSPRERPVAHAAQHSVCRSDNLWAEEVQIAELLLLPPIHVPAPAAAPLPAFFCDLGDDVPGLALSCEVSGGLALSPLLIVRPGRCDVRFGGRARVHLRPREPLPTPREVVLLLIGAERPGLGVSASPPSVPDGGGDGHACLAGGAPSLPPPGPSGAVPRETAPPLSPGHRDRIERPPRLA